MLAAFLWPVVAAADHAVASTTVDADDHAVAAPPVAAASVSTVAASVPAHAPATWIAARDGTPFRVRFEPGHRLFVGVAVHADAGEAGRDFAAAVNMGLSLRAPIPDGDWDLYWKRDHDIAHLFVRPTSTGAPRIQGRLYRGTFIRRSRSGALTIPTTPPLRLGVPFDIGLRIELGRLDGVAWPARGDAGLVVGVVRGDVLGDFWRSSQPGRWIALGVGARYGVGIARDPAGTLNLDHQIAPMTALTLAARTESTNGLFVASIDIEAVHRWSSTRGWEQTARAEIETEIIPLAINDRPVSLFARAGAGMGGGVDADLRALVGLRIVAPLR